MMMLVVVGVGKLWCDTGQQFNGKEKESLAIRRAPRRSDCLNCCAVSSFSSTILSMWTDVCPLAQSKRRLPGSNSGSILLQLNDRAIVLNWQAVSTQSGPHRFVCTSAQFIHIWTRASINAHYWRRALVGKMMRKMMLMQRDKTNRECCLCNVQGGMVAMKANDWPA